MSGIDIMVDGVESVIIIDPDSTTGGALGEKALKAIGVDPLSVALEPVKITLVNGGAIVTYTGQVVLHAKASRALLDELFPGGVVSA